MFRFEEPSLFVNKISFCIKIVNLNPDCACILGLLHDIGRQQGFTGMKCIFCSYKFMFLKVIILQSLKELALAVKRFANF